MVDTRQFLVCDATFRCSQNFGKELASWPADLKVALNRAMANFRVKNPDAGEMRGADIDWSNSSSISAISHPWIVQVTIVFDRKRPN